MSSLCTRWLGRSLVSLTLAGAIHAGDPVVSLDPPPPLGVGDDTTFIINGTPGELPFLIVSPNPGPTVVPFAGQLEVGFPFYVINLPTFPASGQLVVPCPLTCDFINIAPFYAQVVAIELGPQLVLGGKSNLVVLTVDGSLVEDCNGNLIDDDCELETGAPDCDGDGLIDSCEDDCDGNQVPDECEAFEDCNGNSVPDQCDLENNDCNQNGTPDDCEPDCDNDGTPDSCELDCDGNQVPDACETFEDCNGNGVPDFCDIADQTSTDLDLNGIPDECEDCDEDGTPDSLEADCDENQVPDDCEFSLDCNDNQIPDRCDIADGTSLDTDGDGVPDECTDCDEDGTPDSLESDCDSNGTPDDCEPMLDCNGNDVPDRCDISSGSSNDLNGNNVPDECEDCDNDGMPDSMETDCDANGTPDDCEPALDCNGNNVPDRCDISSGSSTDADGNGIPDDCEDCDNDGTPDSLESDCDSNGTPDDCEPMLDCNDNDVPDRCDLSSGNSTDANGNGIPDECEDCDNDGTPDSMEADCDLNGTPDDCEPMVDCNGNDVPDRCDISSGASSDLNNNGTPDDCEPDCDNDGMPDDVEADCDQDGTPDDCEPDCDDDGTPDDCESDCNSNGTPDDCEGCFDSLKLIWDANACAGPYDSFSEFTPVQDGGCSNVSVAGSTLYSPGGHSCTDDALTGTSGGAFCIDNQYESDFTLDNSNGLYLSVTVAENAGIAAQLEGFSFYQVAPEDFFTSQQNGSTSDFHKNDRPRHYGIQIKRDGVEVFLQEGLPTSLTWKQEVFDFSNDPNFTVFNGAAVFDIYLIAYDDQDLWNPDSEVWDLDQFELEICCGQGGPAPDCDLDGTPDFCEPDCDEDGLPDDCEVDTDGDGTPDDCDFICATNMVIDSNDPCLASSNEVDRSFWFESGFDPGANQRYRWETPGQFFEFADGTALLTGRIANIDDATRQFDVQVHFTGRVDAGQTPPAGSPKLSNSLDASNQCYAFDGGPADTAAWRFYSNTVGSLYGAGALAGAELMIVRRGEAFQIGDGANLKNGNQGASGWFDYVFLSQPTGSIQLGGAHGDINMDLDECL